MKQLRKLLMHKEVHLQFRPLNDATARVDWENVSPPSRVRIVVDHDQDGRIRCIIHELLHLVLYDIMEQNFNTELQETAIDAWEKLLWENVSFSPQKLGSWRRAIAKKLEHRGALDEDS